MQAAKHYRKKKRSMPVLAMGMALLLCSTSLSLLPTAPLFAQAQQGNPMVSGQVVRDYARITFYWPEKIDMAAHTEGNQIIINFDRSVNPNFGTILASLYPYVTKAELSANQRTIIFHTQRPYRIRSFITDSESGVDLLDIFNQTTPAPEQREAKAQAAPEKRPVPTVQKRPAAPVKEDSPATAATENTPAPAPAPVEVAQTTPPAPKAKEAPPRIEPEKIKPKAPVAETRQATPAPPIVAVRIAEPEAATPEPAPAVAAPDALPTTSPTTAPAAATATPIAEVKAPKVARLQDFGAIHGPAILVTQQKVDNDPLLTFPFNEAIDTAVWQRGRTVFILFGKPFTLQGLAPLMRQGQSWLRSAQQLGGQEFTLLRLDLATDLFVTINKQENGTAWNLRVHENPYAPKNQLNPKVITRGESASLFIPAPEKGRLYSIIDPVIGDAIDVVPLFASATGYSPSREFVDFNLPEAQQGIIISPKNDDIRITEEAGGILVSTAQGLALSPGIHYNGELIVSADATPAPQFETSLFPARQWDAGNISAAREKEAYLSSAISQTTDMEDKNALRLQLAQLYFMQERYSESVAVLHTIRRDDLDWFRTHKLAAIEGAAHLLNYRFQEAALSLSSDTLDGDKEGELLRRAVNSALKGDTTPVNFLAMNDGYIRQYPPRMRRTLAILAADQALSLGNTELPAKIFATLDADKVPQNNSDGIQYLKGKAAAAAGREKEAERLWKPLAEEITDREFRARAEFSRVLMELENGSLPPKQAAERLEKLRIVWRGDDLERSLLMTLGHIYTSQGEYWDGMKAWEELLHYYPNSPEAIKAYQLMAETFRTLYLDDKAAKMDPVKALALFNEFQELTPLGKDGNKVIEKLVDRMVEIDLLDEAAKRLENQVKYRLKDEEKSRAGARLAMIYVMNREPDKALAALKESRVDNVQPALSLERNRIAAKALIDIGEMDQAMRMIEEDYGPDAENLRVEAYWKAENWPYIIDIGELMLHNREDAAAPLTPEQGQLLLKLALAYQFTNEYAQLQHLRTTYTPLMQGNPYEKEFAFLTLENAPADTRNFTEVLKNISSMQNFVDGYKSRLATQGLSETIAPESKEEATSPAPAPQNTPPQSGQNENTPQ